MKISPEEKQRRRHQRSAARKNARLQADAPLFADQLPQHTAEGEYWHWRRNVANCVIHFHQHAGPAAKAARWIEEQYRDRLARQVLSPERYAQVKAHRDRAAEHGPEYCLDV